MKTILINFVALHGGGTADAFQMVNALANNDCIVYAIISKNMENYEKWTKIKNIHIFKVNGYTTYFNFLPRLFYFKFFQLKKIYRQIKQIKIDAVYIPMVTYWSHHIFAQFKRMRTIYTMHDVKPHNSNYISYIWRISKKLAKKSNEIIVLSNCFKDDVMKLFGKDPDKIYKMSLGCQSYYGDETLEKSKDPDTFNFVFYGIINEYKGLDILAPAYKRLTENYQNVHLTIAGSGNFSPYKKAFDSIDPSKLTIINRWIMDDEVSSFFNTSKNITVIPYKNATQSGIIPIAMTYKSLVIATNCSGLSEQVVDGDTGLLSQPCDIDTFYQKMRFAIDNWKEMEIIIDNAYRHIKKMSWDSIAHDFVERILK